MQSLRLIVIASILCLFLFIDGKTILAAKESLIATQPLSDAPPPLPGGCGDFGTPASYENPVCCVSGYVYVNGVPVEGSEVTITAKGRMAEKIVTSTTPRSIKPFYTFSLSELPLQVEPGDVVTVTAHALGQSQSVTFTAEAGTQQVDVVMPQLTNSAFWIEGQISGRRQHAMAYDADQQGVTLFGGLSDRGEALGDTWSWDGQTWQQQTPSVSPPARFGHTMIFDPVRQQILLFGGFNPTRGYLNDFWRWDGVQWIALATEISPDPRMGHAMAYDSSRQQLVLFGGVGNGGVLADTWIWDGSRWNKPILLESPSLRTEHQLVYFEKNKEILLFGGRSTAEPSTSSLDDTWVWSNGSWKQTLPIHRPPARSEHAMSGHPVDENVVLLGGLLANNLPSNDTWLWDGADWSEMLGSSPDVRTQHVLTYDEYRKRILLFGGFNPQEATYRDFADTWQWGNGIWTRVDSPASILQWSDVVVSSVQTDSLFSFGGNIHLSPQNASYQWKHGKWSELISAHRPPPRFGHQLASDEDSQQVLTFGGIGEQLSYLQDTWLWDGVDWQPHHEGDLPPARANYSLTYDQHKGVWLLFGGESSQERLYLNDTWEFDGTRWKELTPTHRPPVRRLATLTFDPICQCAWLFGGQIVEGLNEGILNDLWHWDGTDWAEIKLSIRPEARYAHGAAYDVSNSHLVIAGGRGVNGAHIDTWAWDGDSWQKRLVTSELPPLYNLNMTYDANSEQMIAVGERQGGNLAGEGLFLHRVFSATISSSAPPIATIRSINPLDARQNSETIRFVGAGSDTDITNQIVGYRWTMIFTDTVGIREEVLSTVGIFSLPASAFPIGEVMIRFEVQDDENTWSEPVTARLLIREAESGGIITSRPKTWTLLIYAIADNNLHDWMGTNSVTNGMLYRLKNAGPHEHVQMAILYDGPDIGDTSLIKVNESGEMSIEPKGEARMDEMTTLSDFISWGFATYDSDYFALALLDHANGIQGFGLDLSSDGSGKGFLSPIELRTALQIGTDDGSKRIDVLHFDGCSFGLFENAAIADGYANFVVASPNTGWGIFAYDSYRQQINQNTSPHDYARAVAQTYADIVTSRNYPFTISVFDMAHFEPLRSAIGRLGTALDSYVKKEPVAHGANLLKIRSQAQKYDSGGVLFAIEEKDTYVDLWHLVALLEKQIADADVKDAATATANALTQFLIHEPTWHASGTFVYQGVAYNIDLSNATGIGIYYPPYAITREGSAHLKYIGHKLFHITQNWGWTTYIAGIPDLGDGSNVEDEPLIAPLRFYETVFLPLVQR